MRLDGKIAIVTGAGGGMGRASALLFAENGARLLLTDKNEESGTATQRMLAGKGHDAIFVPGNVGRRADVQHFAKIAAEAYGRIDILFNNSGSDEGSGDLLAVDGIEESRFLFLTEDDEIESRRRKSMDYDCWIQARSAQVTAERGGTHAG